MSLKAFVTQRDRAIQANLKYAGELDAGAFLRLGSVALHLQLASNAVSHVLERNIKFADLTVGEILAGVQVAQTKSTDPCRVYELQVNDVLRTDQLQSTGTGGIDGTTAINAALGVNPATGKLRAKQATDVELARIAPEGNLFDTDGSVYVRITSLN